MSESFLSALKWLILVEAAVIGTSAFIIADKSGSHNPIIIGVVSYGVIYIMSHFWKDFRDKLLLISIAVFLMLSFASPYAPLAMYVLFGHDPASYDPFYTWAGTVAFIGVPVMTLVFKKYS